MQLAIHIAGVAFAVLAFSAYTSVDPGIKCTRSKLVSGQVVLGLAASTDFLVARGIESGGSHCFVSYSDSDPHPIKL